MALYSEGSREALVPELLRDFTRIGSQGEKL